MELVGSKIAIFSIGPQKKFAPIWTLQILKIWIAFEEAHIQARFGGLLVPELGVLYWFGCQVVRNQQISCIFIGREINCHGT